MTYADIKRNRSEIRKQKREERIVKETIHKNRMCGIGLIFVGIMSTILSNGDVTFAVLCVPMGIYACVTKEIM